MQYKKADAMTLRSDETIWWNTHKDSLILFVASAIAFSSTITTIVVNRQKNVYNIPIGAKYFHSKMIMHAYSLL